MEYKVYWSVWWLFLVVSFTGSGLKWNETFLIDYLSRKTHPKCGHYLLMAARIKDQDRRELSLFACLSSLLLVGSSCCYAVALLIVDPTSSDSSIDWRLGDLQEFFQSPVQIGTAETSSLMDWPTIGSSVSPVWQSQCWTIRILSCKSI